MLIELGEAAPLLVAVVEPRDKVTTSAQDAPYMLGRRHLVAKGPDISMIIRKINTMRSFSHLPVPIQIA
jgi:hypothetical protein